MDNFWKGAYDGEVPDYLSTGEVPRLSNASGVNELIDQLRSRRQLPPASERERIRLAAGLSLRQVGAAVGVTHSLVRHWEQGGTPRKQRNAYAQLLDELRAIAEP